MVYQTAPTIPITLKVGSTCVVSIGVTTAVPQPLDEHVEHPPFGDIDQAAPEDVGELLGLERPVSWGLFDALVGFPIIVIFTLSAVLLIDTALGGYENLSFAVSTLAFQAIVLAWPVAVSMSKGHGPRRDFGLKFDGLSDFIAAVVLGLALLMLAGLVGGFATWAVGLENGAEASNTGALSSSRGTIWLWPLIFSTVIGAPIAEELFFRGLVLGAIKKRFGSILAVIGSSIAFTVPHYTGSTLEGSIVLFAVIGAIGLCLGAYRVRTGRVLPVMIAHGVFNGLVVLATL